MTKEEEVRRKFGNYGLDNKPTQPSPPLKPGSGDGTLPPMEARVTRLEEVAKLSSERFGRVENKLDTLIINLGKLPTRGELIGYTVGGLTLGLAIIGLLIGAMGWLETRASRLDTGAAPPASVVYQLPAPVTPAPPPSAK